MMPLKQATRTTGNVLMDIYEAVGSEFAKLVWPIPEVSHPEVRIQTYTPVLPAANAWLSVLEARIRASIRPAEREGEESTEWLNSYAAATAIRFFQQVADLLPTEPHISGTRSGDLVAEFETPSGSITTVVSDKETVLFGVSNIDPDNPVEKVVRSGSNQLREDIKTFTRKLHLVDGKEMGATR